MMMRAGYPPLPSPRDQPQLLMLCSERETTSETTERKHTPLSRISISESTPASTTYHPPYSQQIASIDAATLPK